MVTMIRKNFPIDPKTTHEEALNAVGIAVSVGCEIVGPRFGEEMVRYDENLTTLAQGLLAAIMREPSDNKTADESTGTMTANDTLTALAFAVRIGVDLGGEPYANELMRERDGVSARTKALLIQIVRRSN